MLPLSVPMRRLIGGELMAEWWGVESRKKRRTNELPGIRTNKFKFVSGREINKKKRMSHGVREKGKRERENSNKNDNKKNVWASVIITSVLAVNKLWRKRTKMCHFFSVVPRCFRLCHFDNLAEKPIFTLREIRRFLVVCLRAITVDMTTIAIDRSKRIVITANCYKPNSGKSNRDNGGNCSFFLW